MPVAPPPGSIRQDARVFRCAGDTVSGAAAVAAAAAGWCSVYGVVWCVVVVVRRECRNPTRRLGEYCPPRAGASSFWGVATHPPLRATRTSIATTPTCWPGSTRYSLVVLSIE